MTKNEIKAFLKDKPGYLKEGAERLSERLDCSVENCRSALKEALSGFKTPKVQENTPGQSQNAYPRKKQHLSDNKVLNDVLNETLMDEDWKSMGGKDNIYDSGKMNDIIGKQYVRSDTQQPTISGDLAKEMGVDPNDPSAAFLKKDFRAIMNAVDKRQGKK